jgi:hypothetical protein
MNCLLKTWVRRSSRPRILRRKKYIKKTWTEEENEKDRNLWKTAKVIKERAKKTAMEWTENTTRGKECQVQGQEIKDAILFMVNESDDFAQDVDVFVCRYSKQ